MLWEMKGCLVEGPGSQQASADVRGGQVKGPHAMSICTLAVCQCPIHP